MRPLVVVDLESVVDPEAGRLTTGSAHHHIDGDLPLVTVGPHDAADALVDARGVFVTGSAAMLDEVDWAAPLAAALEAAARRGVPVLGVCFAHQMLAAHFGGRIASFEGIRKGLPAVTFDADGPFAAETVHLMHTHRDHVVEAPPSMRVVGRGGLGGISALAHLELPVWTLQGHPEWDHVICHHDDPFWNRFVDPALDTPEAKGILRRFGALIAKE